MNDNILSTSGRAFQQFISHLTAKLPKPKAKFIRQLLCGVLFSNDLVLTNVASKVPQTARLTAIAKRFGRQLADRKSYIKHLWPNYLSIPRPRLDINSVFIVDLSDLAQPYAKKMENLTLVRDGDKGCLVTGYCCMEVYCLDKNGIIWPLILWPYSLEAEGQLSENAQILSILSHDLFSFFGDGILSFLQSRCRCIRRQIKDKLRYCREPKSFWFYRLLIALRDAFSNRACRRGVSHHPEMSTHWGAFTVLSEVRALRR